MKKRPLLAIESPYAGDVPRNEAFARNVCRYAVECGHAPFAMHLLYTQFLDDLAPDERTAGIECGLSWTTHAEEVWFCLRPGEELSRGMKLGLDAIGDRRGRILRFEQDGTLLHEELEAASAPPPKSAVSDA